MPKKLPSPSGVGPGAGRDSAPPVADDGAAERQERLPFPIVAVGASAGGIEAVCELLGAC